MKFKIAKKTIQNGLSIVARAISVNTPNPVLTGIKIDCAKDTLILTASNNDDISIQTVIRKNEEEFFEVYEEGSIVIEAKYIIEIVRKIDSDVIDFATVDGSLTKISGDSAEFNINGVKASDYPNIDFSKPLQNFKISADVISKVISQTTFAASDDSKRAIFNGVNFSAKDGVMECLATDSYRLAKKTVKISAPYVFNITIPAKTLKEVDKIIDRDGEVEIAINEKKTQFYFGPTLIQTRLIDGRYPDVSKHWQDERSFYLIVDSQDLMSAIDRASFIKSDGFSVVKISLSADEVVVSSRVQEVGSSVEKLIYEKYEGEPLVISFRGNFVYEAIRVLSTSQVRIDFSTDMKPFVIRDIEDDSIIQLITPVRSY